MVKKMYAEMTEKNVNPLAGRCPHECSYCYALNDRKPNMRTKYGGGIRLDEKILLSNVYNGTRFLCSCNDLFSDSASYEMQKRVVDWAGNQTTVTWWLQTKNPKRMMRFWDENPKPENIVIGATMESDIVPEGVSKAPAPEHRVVKGLDYVTIEPVLRFDHDRFLEMLNTMLPKWINIGADSSPTSKRIFAEPTEAEVVALVDALRRGNIDVRVKPNLKRLAPSLV